MIPFYNFEMASNPYQMVYSGPSFLNMVNPMFQTQYYQPQQVICVGYLPKIENFQIGSNICNLQNSTIQSNFDQKAPLLKEKKSKYEVSKEIKSRQNNQQSQESVLKTKFIKKIQKVKYLKKNTQSNISNQVLTFLADQKKSKDYLMKLKHHSIIQQKEAISKFYEWMDVIRSSTKKYISKKVLLRLSVPSNDHVLFKEFQKMNINLSQKELNSFCKIARILMRIFLTEFSHLTVLTSKKIHRQGTVEHLIRRRQIKNYLEQRYSKI